jgi:hypothetical protein
MNLKKRKEELLRGSSPIEMMNYNPQLFLQPYAFAGKFNGLSPFPFSEKLCILNGTEIL